MTPYVDDRDFTLYVGDVREVLAGLPAESVHCVVTSPPYFGLRDYSHSGQLGLERTVEEHVAAMVGVFREVRRVMRHDATLWLNYGDSFGNKQLLGVPWRLAFALQADGWYLRSDVIWAKPAPMPESVRDRPTKSHEYVFLLTKSARYYFDQEAVREPHAYDGRRKTTVQGQDGSLQHRDGERWPNSGRNIRTVWTINAEPFTEWGQTVRQRRVEADAPDDGKKRTTSPDCPVHGDHPVPVATAADGGRADGSSTRTERSDGRPDPAQLAGPAPIDPPPAQDSVRGSSGSLVPAGSRTASAHSTETHRTASRSSSRGTASSETSGRTEGTSPSSESPAPDGSDSRGSSETPDRTDCTCTWYVEYTDKTSHFATFPQALVEPCVLAGTSERGCCPVCGAPWERETERGVGPREVASSAIDRYGTGEAGVHRKVGGQYQKWLDENPKQTTGWRPTCGHEYPGGIGGQFVNEPVPCTVLDPFMGSGTTALVARRHGRKSIGIELNAEYATLAATRLQQLSLLAAPV